MWQGSAGCSVVAPPRLPPDWPTDTLLRASPAPPHPALPCPPSPGPLLCPPQILKRINAEIEAQRRAGVDLPPPPKTAIAGPEYFGFNQAGVSVCCEAVRLISLGGQEVVMAVRARGSLGAAANCAAARRALLPP